VKRDSPPIGLYGHFVDVVSIFPSHLYDLSQWCLAQRHSTVSRPRGARRRCYHGHQESDIAAEVSIYPRGVAVWGCLISLRIVGGLPAYLPFPKASNLVVIFTFALAKAALVVVNGIRIFFEPRLIYAVADPQTTETKRVPPPTDALPCPAPQASGAQGDERWCGALTIALASNARLRCCPPRCNESPGPPGRRGAGPHRCGAAGGCRWW
jgi:hypothetical protein